jgi:rhamnosyltransferase
MSTTGPSPSTTAAVVVIYHPEGDLSGRLQRLIGQISLLVIIANDGGDEQRVGAALNGQVCFRYVAQGENIGLAAALNQGLRLAVEGGAQWCLLLDQDTVVDSDLVPALGNIYEQCPLRDRIAILAPNYQSPGSGKLTYEKTQPYLTADTVITSGSILRLSILPSVGLMMESFFIEGIDLEFSLRIRKAGHAIVVSRRPLMVHGAGQCEERRLGRRTVLIANHPPWRYYFQFRNVSWILWHYAGFDIKWTTKTIIGLGKKTVLMLLFEHQRPKKIHAITTGLLHGALGRLGKSDRIATRDRQHQLP